MLFVGENIAVLVFVHIGKELSNKEDSLHFGIA